MLLNIAGDFFFRAVPLVVRLSLSINQLPTRVVINDELRQKIYQAVFYILVPYENCISCFPSLFQVYCGINKNINHRRGDRESRALSIDLSNLCVSSNRRSLQSFVKMRQQEPRNPVGVRSRNSNSFTIDSQGNNIPINTVSNSSTPDSDNVDRKPYPMTPSGELFFFFHMITGFRNFFSSPSYHKFERYIYICNGEEEENKIVKASMCQSKRLIPLKNQKNCVFFIDISMCCRRACCQPALESLIWRLTSLFTRAI